jgi:glutamate 5-kinase
MTRRELVRAARTGRIVIKIGSGVLTRDDGRIEPKTIRRIAHEIAPLIGVKRWPYIVSSGAIAVGMGIMGLDERPKLMAALQAAAAIGQSKLVEAWSAAFQKFDVHVAQVLLTHEDLASRRRFLNARHALAEIERRRAIAIINENDTVSFEEIAFGDNDGLAAQVANVIDARILIMLSVAGGITDEHGVRVPEALATDGLLDAIARPSKSKFGSGGMVSKIKSARIACARGTIVAIIEGKDPANIGRLLAGEDVGTVILPGDGLLSSRAHWIAHTLRPAGKLFVDDGAVKALVERKKSLLPSGVARIEGDFTEGDPVDIAKLDGAPFARGLSRYSSAQMERIRGQPSRAIGEILGFTAGAEVVHRDDLVLLDAVGE